MSAAPAAVVAEAAARIRCRRRPVSLLKCTDECLLCMEALILLLIANMACVFASMRTARENRRGERERQTKIALGSVHRTESACVHLYLDQQQSKQMKKNTKSKATASFFNLQASLFESEPVIFLLLLLLLLLLLMVRDEDGFLLLFVCCSCSCSQNIDALLARKTSASLLSLCSRDERLAPVMSTTAGEDDS